MPVLAASAYEFVLAVHIMAVVIAFGVTFAYPVMFAVAARHGVRSMPLLHRIEVTMDRVLVNGGLVVVVAAGIFLASDGHHWSEFFVQWGLGVAIVIGAIVGAVMIPTAKRAEQVAIRDLESAPGAADVEMSAEYQSLAKRLATVGTVLSLLVLVTILIMAVKP